MQIFIGILIGMALMLVLACAATIGEEEEHDQRSGDRVQLHNITVSGGGRR